jgi:hypothetical protein
MHVLKQGNRNTKSLAYASLIRRILEYEATCWDPCREGQINALDRVQKKHSQFTNHTKDSVWEKIARLCAHFKAFSGERAWKAIRYSLRRAYCLSRVDHVRKIRGRKHRTDIGKYSFVKKTIENWNQLSAETLGTFRFKTKICRNRFRKAILNGMKLKE